MSYSLRFHELALKEWRKLDTTIQAQFKSKLTERLQHPHVPASALSGMQIVIKLSFALLDTDLYIGLMMT